MDTANDTLVTRTYAPTVYEPPALPEAERDPNSDTRVPARVRRSSVDVADVAFHAGLSASLESGFTTLLDPFQVQAYRNAILAAVEAAYASGFEAGVRSQQLMDGILTNADEMAYIGSLPRCEADTETLDGEVFCNRAFGHIGDHARLDDDDRAAEADPWHDVALVARWPRRTDVLHLSSKDEFAEGVEEERCPECWRVVPDHDYECKIGHPWPRTNSAR